MSKRISSKEVSATMDFYKSFNEEEKSITPLPKQFIGIAEVKGFIFTQVASTERAYMYEVRQSDSKVWFEVIMRKKADLLIVLRFIKLINPSLLINKLFKFTLY